MAKNILIIEDHEATIEMISSFLQSEGFKVARAANGRIGLEQAVAAKPDLILLDIMMPGINGLEVCKKLKQDQQTASIPIIIVSIKCAEQEIAAGHAAGAVEYIVKPFELVNLKDAIKKQLG